MKDNKSKIFNSKFRILINISILRRDIGLCFLLRRVLEKFGFDVLLSAPSNNSKNFFLWKPDLFITQTLSQANYLKKQYPNIKVLFLDPEGFYLNFSIAPYYKLNKKEELVNSIDLILCWGKVVAGQVKKILNKKDKKKVFIVGNPKLDLVDFFSQSKIKKKKSVGIIGRFPSINSVTGKTTIRTLANDGNLSRVIIQCKDFVVNHKIIKEILNKTDYSISIRPHPLEQISGTVEYVNSNLNGYKDRLEIDKSLVFSEWAKKQDYIITPTTSSFIETYRLGIPLIIIDYIAGTFSYWKKYKMLRLWQENSFCPKSLGKLIEIIKFKKRIKFKSNDIEKQYNDYCDCVVKEPAVFRIAKRIDEFLLNNNLNLNRSIIRVPKFVVRLINIYFNRQYAKKDNLYFESFYDEILHKEPVYIKNMVKFFQSKY